MCGKIITVTISSYVLSSEMKCFYMFSTYNIDTFGSNLPDTTIIWLPCAPCTWIRCTNHCKFEQLTLWDPLAVHAAVTTAICDLVLQEEKIIFLNLSPVA